MASCSNRDADFFDLLDEETTPMDTLVDKHKIDDNRPVTQVEFRQLMLMHQKTQEKLDKVLAWIQTQDKPAAQLAARYQRADPKKMSIKITPQ